MPSTTRKYVGDVKQFLKYANHHRSKHIKKVVRDYLKSVPNNGNALRALKAYFKYIGHDEVVKGFKFPRWPLKIRNVTKKDLQTFYYALSDWWEKALFLFYATSGLRKMEVLSLRKNNVDLSKRIIIPKNHRNRRIKHASVSFYNKEAENALQI